MAPVAPGSLVCVTGAAGFIGSHVVRELLARGYSVRGTVRNPDDPNKTGHLKALPGAEKLTLVSADLLSEESIDAAIEGCEGVLHTAYPVPAPGSGSEEEEMRRLAVDGTLAVLRACKSTQSVKRVVLTSSFAALMASKAAEQPGHVLTEDDWTDVETQRQRKNWYVMSKTLGEKAAWDFLEKEKPQFDLVAIQPCFVWGPMLQTQLNTTAQMIRDLLDGSKDNVPDRAVGGVDVREVATAHALAVESPKASGRYLMAAEPTTYVGLCDLLRKLFPDRKVPTSFDYGESGTPAQPQKFDNRKARELGVEFRPIEQTLKDTVSSLIEKGYLK
eukprot:jgi/Chlat1/6773/Chrsp50S06463